MDLSEFGLEEGINEVIAITFFSNGKPNTAPIGVIVEGYKRAKVRLFPSHTRENVERGGRLWINVIWDPMVWVLSTFEDLSEDWFSSLSPPIIRDALAWCEFRCRKVRDGNPAEFELRLRSGDVIERRVRAINRGFNALIEALVCATRLNLNPKLRDRIEDLSALVKKCGDKRTREAFEILLRRIR